MGRTIDADELIEFINGRISDGSEDPASQYTIIRDETLMEIGSKVKSMPTVPQFGEWVNTKDRFPENAKHKGANCETVLVKTKWGITEGWYNPDVPCWFIIAIFMYYNDRKAPNLIDFKRGDIPKVIRVPDIDVTHWMPLPEPPKEGENK